MQEVAGKCVEKWDNLLIDFRLAGHRHQEPARKPAQRKKVRRRESAEVDCV